jgi:hypothetical protein
MPNIFKNLIAKRKAKKQAKKVDKYVKDRKENPTVINKPHGGKPGPGYMGYSKGGIIQHD